MGASDFCMDCVGNFFLQPENLFIIIFSIAVALTTLVLLRRKKISAASRVLLIYTHIFSLVLPLTYFSLARSCLAKNLTCGPAMTIAKSIPYTLLISVIVGLIVIPLLYRFSKGVQRMDQNRLTEFVTATCHNLGIRSPRMFLVDTAEPIAYSISTIKSQIYLSVGLMDLLTKKEIEAVLLHEIAHIRNRDSLYRFGALFYRIVSPFAAFVPLTNHVDEEEVLADEFAAFVQKTDRYVKQAKVKIQVFHSYGDS